MKSIKILSIVTITSSCLLAACKTSQKGTNQNDASAATACGSTVITYKNGLKPIVDKNCTTSGCHDADFKKMDFTSYPLLKKFADEGEIAKHVLKIKNMPPNHKLSTEELNAFKCWLDNGAKE